MNSILKILLVCICLILPLSANADDCSDLYSTQSQCAENDYHNGYCKWNGDNNTGTCVERCPTISSASESTCQNWEGCHLTAYGCTPCDPGSFNPGDHSSWCQPCDATNHPFSQDSHKVPIPTNLQNYGQSECPWKCDDRFFQFSSTECNPCPPADGNGGGTSNGWYINLQSTQATTVIETAIANSCSCEGSRTLIKTTDPSDANKFRYYCGGCGAGIASSAGGPTTCTCITNSNRKYGSVTMEIANDQGSNTIGGAYAHYECQCPEHSSHAARSANADPNDPTSAACVCSSGFTMIETTSQQYQCSPCPTNAETYNNSTNCTCNEHYYGTLNNNTGECRRCPIGTTIARGQSNTTKADCHVSCNTKFYTNNTNYMRLIPSGNGCSTSGTNGELHQTYNGSQAHGIH